MMIFHESFYDIVFAKQPISNPTFGQNVGAGIKKERSYLDLPKYADFKQFRTI